MRTGSRLDDDAVRYLPFQAVHSPLQSAPYWQNQFDIEKFGGDKNRWTLAAMVLEMDHAVSKVVNATKDFGLYTNTVFILSADNVSLPCHGSPSPAASAVCVSRVVSRHLESSQRTGPLSQLGSTNPVLELPESERAPAAGRDFAGWLQLALPWSEGHMVGSECLSAGHTPV